MDITVEEVRKQTGDEYDLNTSWTGQRDLYREVLRVVARAPCECKTLYVACVHELAQAVLGIPEIAKYAERRKRKQLEESKPKVPADLNAATKSKLADPAPGLAPGAKAPELDLEDIK